MYNTRNPLTIDQIEQKAPAVFAAQPAEHTSTRYQQIKTLDVLNAMQDSGFACVQADQQRSRVPARLATNKHLLRFRDLTRSDAAAGYWPEIVLTNSHDGGASYTLYCGIFRMVCSNGMIAGSIDQALRIRHQGANIPGQVVNASRQIMGRVNGVQATIDDWQGVTLDVQAIANFQDGLVPILDPDGSRGVKDYKYCLTHAARYADKAPDLWTTFNRAQENIIKGRYLIANTNSNRRRAARFARRITSIDANIQVNAALWDYTQKFRASLLN
jgi:hypothetical protein